MQFNLDDILWYYTYWLGHRVRVKANGQILEYENTYYQDDKWQPILIDINSIKYYKKIRENEATYNPAYAEYRKDMVIFL